MTAALQGLEGRAATGPLAAPLSGFRRWGRAVWRALEAHGERRAMRILRTLAVHRQVTDPEFARYLLSLTTTRTGAPER